MLSIQPTEHLAGINIQGDLYDFLAFTDAAHRLTGVSIEEDYRDPYYACNNRLLGICYDIRHAYQGDRDIVVKNNGFNRELMKYHNLVMSENTVYFSVNILFPEAIFIAATSDKFLEYARKYYGKSGKKLKEKGKLEIYFEYMDYVKDCGVIRNFAGLVWSALGQVIGEVGLENILNAQSQYESYTGYAAQYIDKLDFELIMADPAKRAGKLKTMARKIIAPDSGYYQMYRDVTEAAYKYGCSMHEVHDYNMELPDEIEW